MVTMAIPRQLRLQESVERKGWTSQDWRSIGLFLAQSSLLVSAAVLLYCFGPALGVTLIVGSLALWSLT